MMRDKLELLDTVVREARDLLGTEIGLTSSPDVK